MPGISFSNVESHQQIFKSRLGFCTSEMIPVSTELWVGRWRIGSPATSQDLHVPWLYEGQV